MKRWITIGLFTLLCIILIVVSCVQTLRLDDTEDSLDRAHQRIDTIQAELDSTKGELSAITQELSKLQSDYNKLQGDYNDLQDRYAKLKASGAITFNNNLRVIITDIGEWDIKGTVQNMGNKPMESVRVLVAFYDTEGSLISLETSYITDLFPEEIAEWSEHYPWSFDSFAVYALGSKP